VSFPFSDLSSQKVRPVLILSNDAYNQQSADVVVCGLTTNLRHKSKIKADAIASLEQSLLIKQIARLKSSVFRLVTAQIEDLIKLP
jgi:mRNA interferase MazF